MELNRCAYTILGILRTKKATDKVHGITISEISQFEKTSKYSTIHKRIKEMQNLGYIDERVKVCKAKSYFITESGLALLPIKKEETHNV